jgi:TPR repeat protein
MSQILKELKIKNDIDQIKVSAETGNIESQLELTKCILIGHGVRKDIDKGKSLLEKLADSKNEKVAGEANYIMGRCYLERIFMDNKQKGGQGLDFIKKAASFANEDALLFLGNSYFHGLNGVKKEIDLAEKNIRKLANKGNHEAQLNLAKMYETGYEILEIDIKEAIRWYEEAINGKIPEAFNRLGHIYFYGNDEINPNYEKSLSYWEQELKIKNNEETKKMIALNHLKLAKSMIKSLKSPSVDILGIAKKLENIEK